VLVIVSHDRELLERVDQIADLSAGAVRMYGGNLTDYEDLVAAADIVVSKPGYGIVSECVANGVALLYTSRGPFAEYDVFVAEMPRILRCQHISQEDLRAGRWADAIDLLMAAPPPPERPAIEGAGIAADAILAMAGA